MKWYRVDINYLSEDREDAALETSSPAKTIQDGYKQFIEAAMMEKCVDNKNIPARVALIEYKLKKGERYATPTTIIDNYEQVETLKILAAI